MHPPINLLRLADGRVRAVCRFCARQSAPAFPDTSGEPDLWRLARNWSQAPYPVDHVHPDSSLGSLYACPACNARSRRGEALHRRARNR